MQISLLCELKIDFASLTGLRQIGKTDKIENFSRKRELVTRSASPST
jgi:hypothetical protein